MNRRALLLGAIFLTSFGGIVALLGQTTISTLVGTEYGLGAVFTGVLLAVKFAPSIIAMPYSTKLAARFGTHELFIAGQISMIGLNFLLALALALGAPAYLTLLLFTAVMGAIGAMLHVLVPAVMRAYLPSKSMAGSLSLAAVANGAAAVCGALFATYLLATLAPEVAFVVNGVLTVPYVLALMVMKPSLPISSPTHASHTWRTLATTVRTNKRVLRASVLGLGAFLLIGPMNAMVVPLTQDLGVALTSNAGFLLAVLALGSMFTPYGVAWLTKRSPAYAASITAVTIAGIVLVAFALVVLIGEPRWLMYAGVVIVGLVYGNMRQSAENLLVDDVARSPAGNETAQGNIAAFEFFVSFAAPVGPLLWGALMDALGAIAMLSVLGALTAVFAIIMGMFARRSESSALT